MANDTQNIFNIDANPKSLSLKVNESKQLQVNCSMVYDVEITPDYFITYDKINNIVTGVKEGNCELLLYTYTTKEELDDSEYTDETKTTLKPVRTDEKGQPLPRKMKEIKIKEKSISIPVLIKDDIKTRTQRIMFHNRKTNALTTIKVDENIDKNLIFNIPNNDGVLSTDKTNKKIKNIIYKPSIIEPVDDSNINYTGNLKFSPYQSVNNNKYKHKRTIIQYSKNRSFTDLLCEECYETNNLTIGSIKYFGIGYYIRIRYETIDDVSSEWSNIKYIHTKINTKEGGSNEFIIGDADNGGYLGVVPTDTYVSQRCYGGNLHYYLPYISSKISFSANNFYLKYVKDTIWFFKDKLYRAKHNDSVYNLVDTFGSHTGHYSIYENIKFIKDRNNGEWPNLPEADWEEETREGLSTLRLILKDDANYVHTNDKTTCNWDNNPWLKFVYKGKVLFIPSKPVYIGTNWDEAAKHDLVYGNRTLRMGSTYYRIRLPREDELKVMKYLAKEYKKYATVEETVHLENPGPDIIEDMYVYREPSDKTKIDSSIEENRRYSRKIMMPDNTIKIAPQHADSEYGLCYRPVLEVIAHMDEPFNHFPLTPFNPDGFEVTGEVDETDKYNTPYKNPNSGKPITIRVHRGLTNYDGVTKDDLVNITFPNKNELDYTTLVQYYKEDTGNEEEFNYDPYTDTGMFTPLYNGKHLWTYADANTAIGNKETTYISLFPTYRGLWYKFYYRGQIYYIIGNTVTYNLNNNPTNKGEFWKYKYYIRNTETEYFKGTIPLDYKADIVYKTKTSMYYKDYVYNYLESKGILHIKKEEMIDKWDEIQEIIKNDSDADTDLINLNLDKLKKNERTTVNVPYTFTMFQLLFGIRDYNKLLDHEANVTDYMKKSYFGILLSSYSEYSLTCFRVDKYNKYLSTFGHSWFQNNYTSYNVIEYMNGYIPLPNEPYCLGLNYMFEVCNYMWSGLHYYRSNSFDVYNMIELCLFNESETNNTKYLKNITKMDVNSDDTINLSLWHNNLQYVYDRGNYELYNKLN